MGNQNVREGARYQTYGDENSPANFLFENVNESANFEPYTHSDRSSSVRSDTQKLPTVFKWSGGGKNISVSGSFDQWKSKIPMVKSHGDFYAIVDLEQGMHEYKFFVDGRWVCNAKEPKKNNEMGGENNIVTVKKSDFEVFEALDEDQGSSLGIDGSPPGSYTSDIAPRNAESHSQHHVKPPVLPPHLLQVILNKDIPVHCEPNLLPEPTNHVMLNHLYALSIKDGVMVLSATVRYRKKYVTTLLYKPT